MEGRAIARPNARTFRLFPRMVLRLQWRAGQLPGQTSKLLPNNSRAKRLQWRAGQLPGQTIIVEDGTGFRLIPSMEGRAIARPNSSFRYWWSPPAPALQWRAGQLPGQTLASTYHPPQRRQTFNGGPGNCPAKHVILHPDNPRVGNLQWRAGQLPGQTLAPWEPR